MNARSARPEFIAPSTGALAAVAEDALTHVPEELLRPLAGLAILVEDFPDEETCDAMDLDSPYDLLGLYQGTPMSHRSSGETPADLDRVFLFRRPILEYWIDTGEDLYRVVRHVLIHEIGHHFGFSDAEMEALEQRADDDEARLPSGRA